MEKPKLFSLKRFAKVEGAYDTGGQLDTYRDEYTRYILPTAISSVALHNGDVRSVLVDGAWVEIPFRGVTAEAFEAEVNRAVNATLEEAKEWEEATASEREAKNAKAAEKYGRILRAALENEIAGQAIVPLDVTHDKKDKLN